MHFSVVEGTIFSLAETRGSHNLHLLHPPLEKINKKKKHISSSDRFPLKPTGETKKLSHISLTKFQMEDQDRPEAAPAAFMASTTFSTMGRVFLGHGPGRPGGDCFWRSGRDLFFGGGLAGVLR